MERRTKKLCSFITSTLSVCFQLMKFLSLFLVPPILRKYQMIFCYYVYCVSAELKIRWWGNCFYSFLFESRSENYRRASFYRPFSYVFTLVNQKFQNIFQTIVRFYVEKKLFFLEQTDYFGIGLLIITGKITQHYTK